MDQTAPTAPGTESGRQVVRVHLIEALEAEGMRKPVGVSEEEHAAMLGKVVERLAYLRVEDVQRLKPIVAAFAGGKALDRWPSLQTITQHAYREFPPPDNSDKVLWSWLHSRVGVEAREDGTLAATYHFIKRYKRPPSKVNPATGRGFEMEQVAQHQLEINRRRERVMREKSAGEATRDDINWLRAHDESLALCDAIVDAGIAHRRAKATQEAAE